LVLSYDPFGTVKFWTRQKKLAAGPAGSPAASIQPGLVAALTVIRFLGCNGNLFKMKVIELILEFSATTENHAHMVYRVASHILFLIRQILIVVNLFKI